MTSAGRVYYSDSYTWPQYGSAFVVPYNLSKALRSVNWLHDQRFKLVGKPTYNNSAFHVLIRGTC